MNEIDIAIRDLKDALLNDPLVKEFKIASELVHNDSFLIEAEATMKRLQQQMTLGVLNKSEHTKLKEQYDELKIQFESHPYVINYNTLLIELNDLLHELKTIIE